MLVQYEGTIQPFFYHARPWSHIKLTDHRPVVSFKHAGISTCLCRAHVVTVATVQVTVLCNRVWYSKLEQGNPYHCFCYVGCESVSPR